CRHRRAGTRPNHNVFHEPSQDAFKMLLLRRAAADTKCRAIGRRHGDVSTERRGKKDRPCADKVTPLGDLSSHAWSSAQSRCAQVGPKALRTLELIRQHLETAGTGGGILLSWR